VADPFVAEIRMFPFSFAPKGWAFCNGQIMPLSQNTALFSLLGTTYGGNGKSNFALPDLQGSAPMHPGQGPGLSLHDLGETGGTETVTLTEAEIPAHVHSAGASGRTGNSRIPAANVPAFGTGVQLYAPPALNSTLDPRDLTPTGASQPHYNMQPFLALNFCIALQGVFPPRS